MDDLTGSDEQIWLKTAVVSVKLGCSAETLLDWRKSGRIPEHRWRRFPKDYRFHRDWVADPVLLTVRARAPIEAGVGGK